MCLFFGLLVTERCGKHVQILFGKGTLVGLRLLRMW